MGQCMSRKAAGAFAASAAATHNRPTKMHQQQLKSPEDEDVTKRDVPPRKNSTPYSKGVAMSFGFKRRPVTAPSIASNASAARRLANAAGDILDRNGNDSDTQPLTSHIVPTGRSTPRLAPPKKEQNATTRVSRFGYRDKVNRLNKVADLNGQQTQHATEFGGNNINVIKPRTNFGRLPAPGAVAVTTDNNRNRLARSAGGIPQPGRFTLQSTNLPRPEPIRFIETKSAKTLANNNRKICSTMYQQHHHNHQFEELSSKDGSSTEDSGLGSHLSGYMGDADTVAEVEQLESSPTFGARRFLQKPRNLEVVSTGNSTFDVKEMNDSLESCAPLPQLPSAFHTAEIKRSGSYQNTGMVRERTLEYQRHLDTRDNVRKISFTSSEGFSDDYGDEEKTFRDRHRNEKSFIKSIPNKTFLKTRTSELKDDSSPPSSDEQEWTHGGEAMADDISCSLSSSDESRDKTIEPITASNNSIIGAALQNLMSSCPLTNTINKTDVNNILLTIEDPTFAAVAAASRSGCLLDDETLLSPVDVSYSDADDLLTSRKLNRSSSNSKDINEKLTPSTPGTPTNASNSLSLSDGGKDDFLIDDEIADQPGLIFEETLRSVHNETYSISQNTSENTATIVDSTPKPKRKSLKPVEGSPMVVKNKKFLESRSGSLDTLSTCESIASDDLMMDYDYSQSSGLDDCDRQGSGFPSLNETVVRKTDLNSTELIRDWTTLLGNCLMDKANKNASRSRLLRSRTSTPNSVPDSPRSLDSRVTARSRPSATSSPIKSRFGHLPSTGYDSDDSIRLDRANHTAMKQDIISIKTMLLKLRRVLNEQTDEEVLLRSDTHNPFECQATLTNGLFNSLCPIEQAQNDDQDDARLELADLRRQVLFLQGQLEDKEKTVQSLQEQMIKLSTDTYNSNSAPASTIAYENNTMCNAATQTERVRPISAGPSLLNGGTSPDGTTGSLVSAPEPTSRRSRPPLQGETGATKRTPSRLWRKPGEPASPQRYAASSSPTSSSPSSASTSAIPKRANSRSRMPSTPS